MDALPMSGGQRVMSSCLPAVTAMILSSLMILCCASRPGAVTVDSFLARLRTAGCPSKCSGRHHPAPLPNRRAQPSAQDVGGPPGARRYPKSGSIGGFYGTGVGSSRDLRKGKQRPMTACVFRQRLRLAKSRCIHRSWADRPHGRHLWLHWTTFCRGTLSGH